LSTLRERSASQSHFNDLCELLEVPKPTDVDPDGSWFTFDVPRQNIRDRISLNIKRDF